MSAQKQLSHRERLLREGTRQLYAHGFHGTTVDGILDATGVPKGSFYHHFGSKEAFAREALARYTEFQLDLLAGWAAKDLDTAAIVSGYFLDLADRFTRSGHRRACLLGKLSTELAADSATFRRALLADMQSWRAQLADLLRRGHERGDVREDLTVDELADSVLALIQGVFVVALTVRDPAALTSTGKALEVLIRGTR
jgi:TetR/AcrR family transcriptional repressor of nem operon